MYAPLFLILCVRVCLHVYLHCLFVQYLWRPEKSVGSPGTTVTNGCGLSCMCWELNMVSLEESSALYCWAISLVLWLLLLCVRLCLQLVLRSEGDFGLWCLSWMFLKGSLSPLLCCLSSKGRHWAMRTCGSSLFKPHSCTPLTGGLVHSSAKVHWMPITAKTGYK